MHFDAPPAASSLPSTGPWWRDMSRYHWFVLIVASLGWMFDCLDQQLFTMARVPAMKELLDLPSDDAGVKRWGGIVTSIFMIGWATGGLIFGVLGDRWGRAKTMVIAILAYSLCTGLSAMSVGIYDFALYRFLTGLGVGGEFAVGVALVAEVMPDSARARALALLQALSAVGNISAALIGVALGQLNLESISAWRVMFLIGALPALFALGIRMRLKEPERWRRAQHEDAVQKQLGSYKALFAHPTWRRHAILGLLLALSGVVGVWGIGFFSPDLSRAVFRKDVVPQIYQTAIDAAGDDTAQVEDIRFLMTLEGKSAVERKAIPITSEQIAARKPIERQIENELTSRAGWVLFAQQIGAFLGMYSFGYLAMRWGRRPTFAVAFIAAMLSTMLVFGFMNETWHVFVMIPMMGFCQLSVFAGYAIYFAELFPTHLRSTGTSFCYNVGRFFAAVAPSLFGILTSQVFYGPNYPDPWPYRYAGICMSAIYLLGLAVLPFLPETKGKPLPE